MKLLKIKHTANYHTNTYYTIEHGMLYDRLITNLDEYPVYADVSEIMISNNKMLTSLIGSPLYITKSADYENNSFKNLKGGPIVVGDPLYWGSHTGISVVGNGLTSLEGAPLYVRGFFSANHNGLTNLKGSPLYISESLDVSFNPLTSLEGLPLYIGDSLYIDRNTFDRCIAKYSYKTRRGPVSLSGKNAQAILKKYYNCVLDGEIFISDEGWI